MKPLDEVLKALKWTDGQASIYSTLVERGAMKPADIVVRAGVAQGKVYTVLEELRDKGAVIKMGSRPALYDAQNPRHVLDAAIRGIDDLKEQAMAAGAEEAYERRYEQTVRREPCWTVHGINGIQVQLAELAEGCKESLKVADEDMGWLGASGRKILNNTAESRAVMVAGTEAFTEALRGLGARVEARVCTGIRRCCLVDDEAVLVRFDRPDCALVVRDRGFAAPYADRFDDVFKEGKRIGVPKIDA